jgi:ferredoxin
MKTQVHFAVNSLSLNKSISIGSENIFQECLRQGVKLNSTCGGVGSCARCVITIIDGPELLSPMTFEEKKLLGNIFHLTKERLACQCHVVPLGALTTITIGIDPHLEAQKKLATLPSAQHVPKTKRVKKEELQNKEFAKDLEHQQMMLEKVKKDKEVNPKGKGGFKRPKKFSYKNNL